MIFLALNGTLLVESILKESNYESNYDAYN